ncbi:MAG TPA: CHAT domain-containing protein, partial [Abditibacteriaceae bacterium]
VIIPDGPLNALPFAALNNADGKYLVEQYVLSYAPGLSALMEMEKLRSTRAKNQKRVPWLGLARSQFAELGLKPLPGAEAEVAAIAPIFGKSAVVAHDASATKSMARRELPRSRFIHMATHGLLNEAAPLYSSVALSPDKEDPDGRLYARDLMEMNLQADLVVLSACETALGQEVRGEGVLGLTWALFVAGTPASIVTQWSVNDAATSVLMQNFYKQLQSGKTPDVALQTAQIALLKDRKMRHPSYWAPFILVGAGG